MYRLSYAGLPVGHQSKSCLGNFSTQCIDCHLMTAFTWEGRGYNHSSFPLQRAMKYMIAVNVTTWQTIPISQRIVFPATRQIIMQPPIPITLLQTFPLIVWSVIQPYPDGNPRNSESMTPGIFQFSLGHIIMSGTVVMNVTAIPITIQFLPV